MSLPSREIEFWLDLRTNRILESVYPDTKYA